MAGMDNTVPGPGPEGRGPETAGRGRPCPLAMALVHHPVYDRLRDVVTTSVTNLDVHDFARIGRTYDVDPYIVTPIRAQQDMVRSIGSHWTGGEGRTVQHPRGEAFEHLRITATLEEAEADFAARLGVRPLRVVTGARLSEGITTFRALRDRLPDLPGVMVVFGTGWGLVQGIVDEADVRLEPIQGRAGFNHLPVRAAVAIVLDRLLGVGLY